MMLGSDFQYSLSSMHFHPRDAWMFTFECVVVVNSCPVPYVRLYVSVFCFCSDLMSALKQHNSNGALSLKRHNPHAQVHANPPLALVFGLSSCSTADHKHISMLRSACRQVPVCIVVGEICVSYVFIYGYAWRYDMCIALNQVALVQLVTKDHKQPDNKESAASPPLSPDPDRAR